MSVTVITKEGGGASGGLQGSWNATTNTPTLSNSDTGKTGVMYKVSVGGTVNFGGGNITFEVGDLAINDGTLWSRIDATDSVISVAGKTGVVTLAKADVGLSNVANVDTTNASNISSGLLNDSRLNSTVTKAGNTFNTANNLLKLDGSGKIPAVDGSLLTNLPASGAVIYHLRVANDLNISSSTDGTTSRGSVTLPAGTYRVRGMFPIRSTNVSGHKLQIKSASGYLSTMFGYSFSEYTNSGVMVPAYGGFSVDNYINYVLSWDYNTSKPSFDNGWMGVEGTLVVSASDTIHLYFAQSTSHATPATLKKGGSIMFIKE